MDLNPKIISEGREADVDKNIWKVIVLGILAVAASFFAVFYFQRFLVDGRYSFSSSRYF